MALQCRKKETSGDSSYTNCDKRLRRRPAIHYVVADRRPLDMTVIFSRVCVIGKIFRKNETKHKFCRNKTEICSNISNELVNKMRVSFM